MTTLAPSALESAIGSELGASDWITVDQDRINAFADITEDWQFIHVDPERAAKETPFGGAIAHGFLTLSLMSRMAADVNFALEGLLMGFNYGCDKLRFLAPVPAGARVRGRFILAGAEEKAPGRWLIRMAVSVEVEGEERPAMAAEWLVMQVVETR